MTYTRLNPVDKVTTTQDYWTITTRTDGMVEIKKDLQITVNAGGWASWQFMYYAVVSNPIDYPLEFKYRPTIRAELYRSEGNEVMGFSFGRTNNAYTKSPSIYVLSPTNYNSATTVGVTLYVTGTPA